MKNILRKIIRFLSIATIVGFASFSQVLAANGERPNVILVMTDDQGYGDLGCRGNPVLKTPHLDQLHSESIRFADLHGSPFCTPTWAALLTDKHPAYRGVFRVAQGGA